ncbi:uncharacterized protein TM35_000301160 [Trypanosoma theileri]|uniref:Uncharacterized protein n=1 Tax=Trypanosoma theileri TaxID=67003 RepID=A0A1X0NMY2_9TRYP|nr:uncharacterized protein TM35_000301160 [Trypanosoma theileri]ORC86076.1 hypothetical protein TM35_000301160 [Trypanosoma theileri]
MMMRGCSSLSDGRVSTDQHRSSVDEKDMQKCIFHEEEHTAEEENIAVHSNTRDQSTKEQQQQQQQDDDKEELLRTIGITLRDAAEREIKAEIERDSRDGTAAIPPLPPLGWKVQHPAGSNYFVMTHTLLGGVKSAELHARRYQSVHDVFLQAMKEKQGREGKQRHDTTQTTYPSGNSTAGDSNKSYSNSTRMTVGYDKGNKRSAVLRDMMDTEEPSGVKRADVHLTLFTPFRVYDPSSHDPTVSICEWSSFDLLVRKTVVKNRNRKNMNSNTNSGSSNGNSNKDDGSRVAENPLESMAHLVEESGLCLFVRLASVDSEMRIRSVQLLSRRQAQSLEEHVCFGKGEPIFLELLHSYRQPNNTTRPLRSVRRYDDPLTLTHSEEVKARRDGIEATSSIAAVAAANNNNNSDNNNNVNNNYVSSTAVSYGDGYELLVNCFDSGGEYSRALCYNGPCVSELSKEMIVALHEYLQGDLGISSELCEYVCQMQFFLEQEEYMSWLGRVRHLASVVSQ